MRQNPSIDYIVVSCNCPYSRTCSVILSTEYHGQDYSGTLAESFRCWRRTDFGFPYIGTLKVWYKVGKWGYKAWIWPEIWSVVSLLEQILLLSIKTYVSQHNMSLAYQCVSQNGSLGFKALSRLLVAHLIYQDTPIILMEPFESFNWKYNLT